MIDQLLENGTLTPEQYDAITDPANEVLCLACAGSGKSRTLAFRIARLILEGNQPQSIIAFTFTEKAAESIKRRVADALEKCRLPIALVGAMYIGTIHSYCQNLLGEIDAKYRQFEVLDENGLKLFLLSRFNELGLTALRNARNTGMFKTIAEVANAWKISNDELLSFDEIEIEDEALGGCLKNIYNRLNRDQYLDFSLMIRLAVEKLQEDNVQINRALQEVRHLMVDEYQDINPSQEALITNIHARTDTLFVVGDDDQAIYGWRGADVRNIIEFDQRYSNCSRLTLSTNFRSTETIVDISNRFIQLELGPNRIDKTPVAHANPDTRHVANVWFDTRENEARWIAARINELLGTKYIENDQERGLTKSDFAILMRSVLGGTRNGAPPYHRDYTSALSEAGIEYIIDAEGSIFERPHARVLRDAMELLRDPGVARNVVTDFFQNDIIPIFPYANLNIFINVIAEWNNEIHRPIGGARRKVYPQKLVHDLLKAFNLSQTTFENHEQVMRDLGVFSSIILDVEKVFISIDTRYRYVSILNFLGNVAETGYDTSQVELMSRPDAVTVSTIHKMKGLEYPVVFIVDLVNQRFPGRRQGYNGWLPDQLIQNAIQRGLYQTDAPSEARLFYTAVTRAERFLYMTGSEMHTGLANSKKASSYKLRINELNHPEVVTETDNMPNGLETIEGKMRVDEDSMPTSFTEIKDYLECPMKYKFRKIYGFSPAVPELFGFGLTTHTAINRVHQLFTDLAPSVEDAEGIVVNVFHLKHVFQSERPDARGPYENAKNASKRIVGEYVRDYPDDFIQSRSVEQRFEIKAGKALITGSIDLLLREDNDGNLLDASVIDFKSMDAPEEGMVFFWINLALQVQLYAYAADIVLGERAKTGSVHLLKMPNAENQPNRINVPINNEALKAAIDNVEWAVDRILGNEFPMRPSRNKCEECDFNKICAKRFEQFSSQEQPPEISIPSNGGTQKVRVRCFSDIEH